MITTAARSIRALVLFGAIALLVSACAGNVIDDQKTEGAVKASLERSLHEKIKSVDCPAGEKVEPGKTFTCAVDFSTGEEATATLKIVNKEADLHLVELKANKANASTSSE